jgi:monoterpene epsilon-lactone hydrolase
MPVTYDYRKLSPQDKEAMQDYWAKMPPPPQDFKFGENPMPTFPPVTLPAGVFRERVSVNGIKALRVYSKHRETDRVVLHFHGGGYVWGSPEDGMAFMVEVKKRFGIDSYSVDYSRAPRHQYPVQLNECLAFYQGLIKMGYKKIALAGESAGGNMCLALTLKLKDSKIRLPAAVVSMSGVLDFTLAGGVELKDIFVVGMGQLAKDYAGEKDLTDPYISPVYGDFHGFPPLLLQAGSLESLATDAKYLAKKIESTDCECTLSIWEGAWHTFSAGHEETPVGTGGLAQALDFINKYLA